MKGVELGLVFVAEQVRRACHARLKKVECQYRELGRLFFNGEIYTLTYEKVTKHVFRCKKNESVEFVVAANVATTQTMSEAKPRSCCVNPYFVWWGGASSLPDYMTFVVSSKECSCVRFCVCCTLKLYFSPAHHTTWGLLGQITLGLSQSDTCVESNV